jgi:hypothetical protein
VSPAEQLYSKHLTDRRDGRPTQQLNITGAVAQFTPDEIERARAVIRELSPACPRVLEEVPATPLNSNVALAQLD